MPKRRSVQITGSYIAIGSGGVQFLAGAGSAALPSYAWGTSQNTGMYLISPSVIGFSCNAGAVIDLRATGLTLEATMGLQWNIGSPQVKLFRDAANVLTVQCNAQNSCRFTSDGMTIQGSTPGMLAWANGDPTLTSRDTAIQRGSAGVIWFGNGTTFDGTCQIGDATHRVTAIYIGTGKIAHYNSVATAGWGVATIYASGRSAAVSASANTVINAFAVPAADSSYEVLANVLITTLGSGSFTVTVSYTDESNTARTTTLAFLNTAGSYVTTLNAAAPFQGSPIRIRCKASTTVSVQSVAGTFTGCTYNIEASLVQIA